jgi:phage-related protein
LSEFTYVPQYATSLEVAPKILKAQFGDGYTQRSVDGINTQGQKWNLNFSNTEHADLIAIIAFMAVRGGYTSFTWTPPDGTEISVVCEKWGRSIIDFSTSGYNLVFEEVFDL